MARILVIDDDPIVRELVPLWLRTAGYMCDAAPDAASAWSYLQRQRADLVTLDISMPGQSGLELLKRLRSGFPELEVVMMTSSDDASTAIEALTQGAFAYLIKPVEAAELLVQVERGLERREWRRERRLYTERLEKTVCEQTLEIRLAHEETIHRLLTASMLRDEETGAHLRRTGLCSEAIARAAGWTEARAAHLRLAAPMHDVGKIGIPDAILRKPGRLTTAEYELMKTHTTIGARMLGGSRSVVLQLAERIALAHHERWDGRGYPLGRSGTAIPEGARIVALADVYDALTHDRVYRRAMAEDEVLDIMHTGRGTHFDPELFDAFLAALPAIRRFAAEHPDNEAADLDLDLLDVVLEEIGQPPPARSCAVPVDRERTASAQRDPFDREFIAGLPNASRQRD
jgi:putative two-component system response regulator